MLWKEIRLYLGFLSMEIATNEMDLSQALGQKSINTRELGMHKCLEVHLFCSSQLFWEIMIHQSSWFVMKQWGFGFIFFSCQSNDFLSIMWKIHIQVQQEAFTAKPRKSVVQWAYLASGYEYNRRKSWKGSSKLLPSGVSS